MVNRKRNAALWALAFFFIVLSSAALAVCSAPGQGNHAPGQMVDAEGGTQIESEQQSGTGGSETLNARSETGGISDPESIGGAPSKKDPSEGAGSATGINSNREALTCSISISCATILDNMDLLHKDKADLVPSDGWILKTTSISFTEGESVFDVLLRVCKDKRIHMEFNNVPMYNSAYIEGIGNLYEFDCGALSGWMYSINDYFPNYGSSRYALQPGDVIRWMYSCDLGEDVGGSNFPAN